MQRRAVEATHDNARLAIGSDEPGTQLCQPVCGAAYCILGNPACRNTEAASGFERNTMTLCINRHETLTDCPVGMGDAGVFEARDIVQTNAGGRFCRVLDVVAPGRPERIDPLVIGWRDFGLGFMRKLTSQSGNIRKAVVGSGVCNSIISVKRR